MFWRVSRLLRVPWTARKSNQSILKEITPEYSLERLMLKLKLLKLQHRLDGHEFEQALGVGDGQRGLVCCRPWGRKELDKTERLSWTDVKNWLIGKDPDAGKDWRQEEKETTEDEMVGWHHQFYGHEFEQTPGVGDGQGDLACCSPWGHKESDTTERLNWLLFVFVIYLKTRFWS